MPRKDRGGGLGDCAVPRTGRERGGGVGPVTRGLGGAFGKETLFPWGVEKEEAQSLPASSRRFLFSKRRFGPSHDQEDLTLAWEHWAGADGPGVLGRGTFLIRLSFTFGSLLL